jgi:hypothetical protein
VEPDSKAATEVQALFDALRIPAATPAHSDTGTHVQRSAGETAHISSGVKV